MGYILYHTSSNTQVKWHKTEKGAKISATASNKNAGKNAYAVMEESKFNELYNKLVPTKNLMTGLIVMIPAQEKGSCMDPGTERYWTM
jgi:hypothetical protein